ncbi:MAG: insulinase family protein, partial [Actinomycetota bacterium]|nr:insulinase family protein [Actinomycetota bacterium]
MTRPVPSLTAPRKPRKLTVVERVLPSGLHVAVVRKPGVPLVELRLRIPFLSTRPTHPARGALLSDSMLTGAGDYDLAGLAGAVQGLGGELSVGVDADRLLVGAHVLAPNLRPVLAILATVLTESRYPTAEVATERERLVERLTIARSRPGVVASEALGRRMWGGHPYAVDLPTPEAVAAATAAQVRTMHAELVRPSRAMLVIVGDISPNRALDQVEAALAPWTGAAPASRVPALPPPPP